MQSKLEEVTRHPFLKNSERYANRDDFTVALKRNPSFQFFEVSHPSPAPAGFPPARAAPLLKARFHLQPPPSPPLTRQLTCRRAPRAPSPLPLEQEQGNAGDRVRRALRRCHDMFVAGAYTRPLLSST
jgi:hypothetical protein